MNPPPDKPHRVLVISTGWVHPVLPARMRLKTILDRLESVSCIHRSRVEDLVMLKRDAVDAVVLYFHKQAVTTAALGALQQFVSSGGGALAIHSASASFKLKPAYFDILGGRFAGHRKVGPITIKPGASDIFRNVKAFTIRDELYRHEMVKTVDVHFYIDAPDGPEPCVWTHTYGKGRVAYLSPGHCASTMKAPEIRRIIRQGLGWVLAGDKPEKRAGS